MGLVMEHKGWCMASLGVDVIVSYSVVGIYIYREREINR